MKTIKSKSAFSMLTAIIVILLMGSVSLYVLNISANIVKSTTIQYQREQAMLYAKSFTEYAIMAITANDRQNTNCLNDIDTTIGDVNNGGYNINVRIAYIGANSEISNCSNTRKLSSSVTTTATPLNVIIDTYVRYKDPDHPDISNAPWITYHRRTLQKI